MNKTILRKNEDLVGHSKLIACKERLALRNFFSEYERDDARNAWREFRQEDLIAHIGLSQFAQIARKCEASVRVMSNKYSKLTDEKRYFYHAYNRKKLLIESDKKNIPLNKKCDTWNASFSASLRISMFSCRLLSWLS